jgi:hypothetical protein
MGNTLLQVFQGILQQDGFVKNNGKIVHSHSGAMACGIMIGCLSPLVPAATA